MDHIYSKCGHLKLWESIYSWILKIHVQTTMVLLLLPREEKVALKKALMPALQRWKSTYSKVLLANITSSFSKREVQFMLDEEANGFKFQSFTNCCYHGVFVTHTHTHLSFFGANLCDFAPFLQNLGFFLCQQINDLLGKKGQNPPPKKSSFTYTWSKLVAKKKYIYMDVRFFPSYF